MASRWNRTWWTQLPDGPTTVSKSWKQRTKRVFGGGGIVLATAVGHRLPAAGLIERILDRAAESLEELQGRDAHLREEGVDVTGDEEPKLHWNVPPMTSDMPRVEL